MEAEFQGRRHLVTARATPECLEVEVEDPASVEFWRGRFAAGCEWVCLSEH